MSEEFTDGNLTDEEFTDETIITGRIKEAPMTPVDILLGPTLLFACGSTFYLGDHHFPGAIPVSAGRRVSHEASQVRFT